MIEIITAENEIRAYIPGEISEEYKQLETDSMRRRQLEAQMLRTIYVCGKCGESAGQWENIDNWLIGSIKSKSGQMVIRCPQHITRYAIHQAGGHIEYGKGVVNNWVYDFSHAE